MTQIAGRSPAAELDNNRRAGFRMLLMYSLLFCIFTAGIFGVLILAHRNFMQFHDAYKQGAFRLIELQNQLHSILAGDGFNFWSWYEGPGLDEPLENFVDPCSFIGSLFPLRYIELGFTVAALLRMYIGGLAFLLMGRETGLGRSQRLVGAILYVFTACFIGLALRQSEHLINAYLFPLLVTCVDRIYKGKSPVPFILTVAYYTIAAIYFAYMSGIVIVIYIALRYFAYDTRQMSSTSVGSAGSFSGDKFSVKDYFCTMLKFIDYGLIGLMLSAFTSLFSAFSISRASTGSSVSLSNSLLFFGSRWYASLGKIILGTGTTGDYMDIGIPMIAMLLIPVAIKHINRRSTNTIMTLILFTMLFIPFFCRMFNGFGYESTRWSYALVLFSVWTGAEQLTASRLCEKGTLPLMSIGLALIALWTAGLYAAGAISLGTNGKVYVALQLLSGIMLVVAARISGRQGRPVRSDISSEEYYESSMRANVPTSQVSASVVLTGISATRQKTTATPGASKFGSLTGHRLYAAVLIAAFIPLAAGWSYSFHNNIEDFARNATIYNKLSESTLRAGNQIDDDGFYRIDSVDAISRHTDIRFPSNENIWWKTNNIFIYNSRIPQSLIDFNVEMGNSYGYTRRVFMVSNGNRMGLDFLYGVRYFLGNDAGKGAEFSDSDNYADYGFEKDGEIDGVTVFKNKYDVGLGFVLDKVMPQSEFDKLDRAEREQVLMEAAVVPDEEIDECGDVDLVASDEIELDIQRVPFRVVSTDNVEFRAGSTAHVIDTSGSDDEMPGIDLNTDGSFVVGEGGGSFTIAADDIPDSQLLVSFDNLLRDSEDGIEGRSFNMDATNGLVTKYVLNESSRQGVDGLRDYDMSMGHVSGSEEITINLSEAGTYTFDDFYLSAMSTAFYDECAEECMENGFVVTDYDDRTVTGTVSTRENGILFLSIPAYDNWDIYVDGEKTERIDDLDIGFAGAYVPAGTHTVMLKYDNIFVKYGGFTSLCGLILLAGVIARRRRARGQSALTESKSD